MAQDTISRSLHDIGLAAWFGGTLANAVALNPAAAEADTASGTGRVANAGWNRWTPVNGAAIGAHLIGSVGQLIGNKERIGAQQGVATMAITKTVLTAAALAATGYSRLLGNKVDEDHSVAAASATDPAGSTPPEVARAQRNLKTMQWVIPVLTGALVVVTSFAGEQQRPSNVKVGVLKRYFTN